MHAFDWRYWRGGEGSLSIKALPQVAGKGAMKWHLKGVVSVEDGLYAIWSYRGVLKGVLGGLSITSHGVSVSSDTFFSFPLVLFPPLFFFLFFFLSSFFFLQLYNSAYSGTPGGGKAAQYCLN